MKRRRECVYGGQLDLYARLDTRCDVPLGQAGIAIEVQASQFRRREGSRVRLIVRSAGLVSATFNLFLGVLLVGRRWFGGLVFSGAA